MSGDGRHGSSIILSLCDGSQKKEQQFGSSSSPLRRLRRFCFYLVLPNQRKQMRLSGKQLEHTSNLALILICLGKHWMLKQRKIVRFWKSW